MVLRAQRPLGTIAQFFHFVAEEKKKKKEDDKKTKAFYEWATTGILVIRVQNDILRALGHNTSVKLLLLDLSFIIDNCLCMEQHVRKIRNDASYHLRNIAKISKYLT